MHRRTFVRASVAATAAAAVGAILPRQLAGAEVAQSSPNFRLFEVTTRVDIANPAQGMQLWLPLFQSAGAYQKLVGISWDGNANAQIDRDALFGANILHARWDDGPQRINVVQRIATWERAPFDGSPAVTAAERTFWTRPGAGIPTSGIVRDTARRIVGDLKEPKAQARAIYDWVVANTWRDAAVQGCGTGDIAAMLKNNSFGGKCVDINSLMVGLCRAVGIPAREVYGIRLAASKRFKSLGRSGDITGAQHCRAEVYLEKEGWFSVDPADVRKAVLEEKLPVDSPPFVQLANDLFGSWESNWAGYNSATGIKLAGAPQAPNFKFLMYPCAMTPNAVANCLDARAFAYRISSAEITA